MEVPHVEIKKFLSKWGRSWSCSVRNFPAPVEIQKYLSKWARIWSCRVWNCQACRLLFSIEVSLPGSVNCELIWQSFVLPSPSLHRLNKVLDFRKARFYICREPINEPSWSIYRFESDVRYLSRASPSLWQINFVSDEIQWALEVVRAVFIYSITLQCTSVLVSKQIVYFIFVENWR